MKIYGKILFAILTLPLLLAGLSPRSSFPELELDIATPRNHIAYLASDELRGRDTGTPGGQQAAEYIAGQYRNYGLDYLPGLDDYFQPVPLSKTAIPTVAEVSIEGESFQQGENLLLMDGEPIDAQSTLVFAGYGWVDEETEHDDYEGLDVAGKVVVTIPGSPSETGMRTAMRTLPEKQKWATERGALGVLQIYQIQYPWANFKRRYQRPRLQLVDPEATAAGFSGWVYDPPSELIRRLKDGASISVHIRSEGARMEDLGADNVGGLIRGTDPALRDEYILLTAHYDHVGVGQPDVRQDSIYNGARDNAMGVAALLAAAEALAKQPPKRSVIVLAVTAEEKGLLGSRYYAEHPLVPLEKTVFNLNTDGGGYNDTTAVSAIGYGRTGTDFAVDRAVELAGLDRVIANPAPRQNLFDRSDNVSFARQGVPCLTISPGFSDFDEEIGQYYHRPGDEATSLNFDYVLKFCQTFAHAARLIADHPERPRWVAGDKYEAVGKKLYGEN